MEQNQSVTSNATLTSTVEMTKDKSGKKKQIKLVDKTKRAFSISIESSKAFELAIRKPRKKVKHILSRIKGMIYAVYCLLLK